MESVPITNKACDLISIQHNFIRDLYYYVSGFLKLFCFIHEWSEWVLFNEKWAIFQLGISWREQVNFQWDDDIRFVFDQYA
jgi:hypothetical protein